MATAGTSKPSSSSSPSSSHSPIPRYNHDVFLSFRGADTRGGFTDRLYSALIHAGIHTFRDDEELPRGKEISSQLLSAIAWSQISIVVFSKNYASSRWCLEELAKIIDCMDSANQLVLPVFYGVDPSDVRKQSGSFAEAFARHEERFAGELQRVEKWRTALTRAGNLSGWDLCNMADGHESKFIRKIIQKVLLEVKTTNIDVAMHPVGLDSRVEDVVSFLRLGLDDVRIIGIYGMGGIGKTTVAKAVYKRNFSHFDGSCFLENVKDISDINRLQDQLLSRVLKTKIKVADSVNRADWIKKRLRSKRVLIVLDDLDKLSQVNSLAGGRDWFGLGSRIIITTKDEHLLNHANVDDKYEVDLLNYDESLELFCWHAFRNPHPLEDYMDLSDEIVTHAGGLPLALQVIGSYLLGRTVAEWQSAFEKLQKIPHKQIVEKLRISFDALDDDYLKAIFLDIACFFIGADKDEAIEILNGCGFFSEIGVHVLINRCLVKVGEENKLMMHDMLRDMGRAIVHQEAPLQPGSRSRLWFHEEILDVLDNCKGTKSIEGIVPQWSLSDDTHFSTKAFTRMERLRLLEINHAHLSGSFEHVSKELKWLCWHFCPLKCLPSNFDREKLVVLDMQHSHLTRVWDGVKYLKSLKVLKLSYCRCLLKTPDFTGVSKLEKLFLNGCESLLEIHPSIGKLAKLVILNLDGCQRLKNLPNSICSLLSLEHLNIDHCSSLESLPEKFGSIESLREFSAEGTAIKQLPESFGHLKNLKSLMLHGNDKRAPPKSWVSRMFSWFSQRKSPDSVRLVLPSISNMSYLQKIVLRDCNIHDDGIPFDIGNLPSLQELDLAGNVFHSLPSSLSQLPKLEKLLVNQCRNLQSLPKLPSSLEELMANDCSSLEELPSLSNFTRRPHLYFSSCCKLAEIQGLESFSSVGLINIEDCGNLALTFKDNFFQGYSESTTISDLYLPRGDIPFWFSYQRMGSSITFDMPLHMEKIHGITFWAAYDMSGGSILTHFPIAVIADKTNDVELKTHWPVFGINCAKRKDHSWVSYIPLSCFDYTFKGGENIEVSFRMDLPLKMKRCAVHLVDRRIADQQGPCSSINANVGMDDVIDGTRQKRERDVDAPYNGRSKRLRLELDPTV